MFLVKYIVAAKMIVRPMLPINNAKSASCKVTNKNPYIPDKVSTKTDTNFRTLKTLKE